MSQGLFPVSCVTQRFYMKVPVVFVLKECSALGRLSQGCVCTVKRAEVVLDPMEKSPHFLL